MAILSEEDRVSVWKRFMQNNPDIVSGAMTKAELRAAVDAIDQWCEANASSFNQAIPQPARGVLTTKQKAQIFTLITTFRYGVF